MKTRKKFRSYKTELKLNNKQHTLCMKAAGCARFVYNWGLAMRIDEYGETGKSLNSMALSKLLTPLKQDKLSWMYEVSSVIPTNSLRGLDKAYENFFRRVKAGAGDAGFPKFKSRSKGICSFTVTECINVESDKIKLPRMGSLRLKESGYLPLGRKVVSATVSEKSGRWFVSLIVEKSDNEVLAHPGSTVGIDVGIKTLAVTSKGEHFENPQALRKHEKKLARLQRQVSRKKKGSSNRKKAVKLLTKHHLKIANIRKDSSHKASNSITKNYALIGVEKLNVAGMVKNRHLAKSISDAGFGELIRQLKYKAEWRGGRVVEADRFYPSSKTCSACGNVKEKLSLSERTYECEACGLKIDRDLNAAINLENTASSAEINACGDGKITEPSGSVAIVEAGNKQRVSV